MPIWVLCSRCFCFTHIFPLEQFHESLSFSHFAPSRAHKLMFSDFCFIKIEKSISKNGTAIKRNRYRLYNTHTRSHQPAQPMWKKWIRAKNNNKFNHNKVYKQIITYGIVHIKLNTRRVKLNMNLAKSNALLLLYNAIECCRIQMWCDVRVRQRYGYAVNPNAYRRC